MSKKILYFQCNSGISGDMTLGALIDLGVDVEIIKEELAKLNIDELNIDEFDLIPDKTQRSGITGTDLNIDIEEEGHSHRSYKSIKEMIQSSDLRDNVKKTSIDMFSVIAKAEAAVHDMDQENVVFHEVGALDSIIDLVGTAIAVDILKPDEIQCSSVHDGSGFIECRHGNIPVPVPAVMEILKYSEIPIVIEEDIKTETVTPTGIGILEGLKAKHRDKIEFKVDNVGYGFGKRDTGRFSAVRVILGTRSE